MYIIIESYENFLNEKKDTPKGTILKDGDTLILKGEKLNIIDIDFKRGTMEVEPDNGMSYEGDFANFDCIAKSGKLIKEGSELFEGKVSYKRKYTESYPSKYAYSNNRIKSKILEAIADGFITNEEFNKILKELNANKRWVSRNSHLFSVNEEGISLSKTGKKIFYRSKSTSENVMLNPGMNVAGMGPVKFPGNAGTTTAFHGQNIGSGDVPTIIIDPKDKKNDEEEEKKRIKRLLKSKEKEDSK